jgi:hypothetical protein
MLNPKQERAILALLAADDQKSAAEAAGVAEQTLCRWLKCAEFSSALQEARQQFRTASIRELARRRAEALQPA